MIAQLFERFQEILSQSNKRWDEILAFKKDGKSDGHG